MTKIAVLLTCFNRINKTVDCLEALHKAELAPNTTLHVFLVDDGSTDSTGKIVKSKYPDVTVIEGTGSLYWNRGMYLAWQTAAKTKDFDYYLLLNDDTILYQKAIIELLECTEKFENGVVVCGAVCSEYSEAFTYGGKDKLGNESIPNGEIQECFMVNGNSLLVDKKAYMSTGILDPIFPHAIGDYDYGFRAKKNGSAIITTKAYVGTCEKNDYLPKWCYSNVPITQRFKALYSPLGNSHPYYYFIYEKRHFGLIIALKHFLSIHLRALIPNLWK